VRSLFLYVHIPPLHTHRHGRLPAPVPHGQDGVAREGRNGQALVVAHAGPGVEGRVDPQARELQLRAGQVGHGGQRRRAVHLEDARAVG